MLKEQQKNLLHQLINSLSKEQLIWINGYISGISLDDNIMGSNRVSIDDLTIIYVTETGNSKFIADKISQQIKSCGGNVKMKESNQYRLKDFEKEKNLIFIISTHGDGEIPEPGKKLYDYLHNNELNLEKLKYFVIALGDMHYPLFCQSGKDIDSRLETLKAERIAPRIDLDLDFEDHISRINNQVIDIFSDTADKKELKVIKTTSSKKDFVGEIVSNVNLNDIGSNKETRHIEICVEDGINYEPGDAIGIVIESDKKNIPRLYSIASSVNEFENEVHLTVAVIKYIDKENKKHLGKCSNYLASLAEGDKVKFYLSKNRKFKLPKDDQNIIMVGPGTGIAPFRSFLQERSSKGASGKNWLFFGDHTFQNNFLYQREWQDYFSSGLLNNLDVAFSRDQKEKIYVQHRMQEKSKELFNWIDNGAYFYVCGDKENMAKEVENTLLRIIVEQGSRSAKEARDYLNNLIKQEKYLTDVYS